MTRAVGLANAALLAPLLGVTDTLPKALSFLALSALTVTLYGLVMRAVGDRMDVMCELHSMWNRPQAVRIARALEPYDPLWVEDPVIMDHMDAIGEVAFKPNDEDAVKVAAGSESPPNDGDDDEPDPLPHLPAVRSLLRPGTQGQRRQGHQHPRL